MTPAPDRGLLRILTCGSVDDGKSTLIGRLLFDAGLLPDDTLSRLAEDSRRHGTAGAGEVDLALLVDGLEAEREQGITIDVAHRFFATPRRSFIVADTPGHEQYTRNMATGASNSDLAVILVDSRRGLAAQTRRHTYICSLFGIRHAVLAVNKIDLVGFSAETFGRIAAEWRAFATDLGFRTALALPVSARHGDNVVRRSDRMPWHDGPSLLEYLEEVASGDEAASRPLRLPVQWVNRPEDGFRGYCGRIASGRLAAGDRVVVAASGRSSRVARLLGPDGEVAEAAAGDAVTVCLADELDVARGDVLAHPDEAPALADQFAAHLLWMDEEPMLPGRQYVMRIGHLWTGASVTSIRHRIDTDTLEDHAARRLELNQIGVCNLTAGRRVPLDPYADLPGTGGFILVDRFTNRTVAAGIVDHLLSRATNIHRESYPVDRTARAALLGQNPAVLWFTGLSGSGKSTIAKAVERRLHAAGRLTYTLDGDNLRLGMNRDLGFTDADRVENIRRAGEIARLFVDAGVIVLCSFISPFRAERRSVRDLFSEGEFVEIFVDTPIEECIRRDPKGLYEKARSGRLANFTGISSGYEAPEVADLHLRTTEAGPDALADIVVRHVAGRQSRRDPA